MNKKTDLLILIVWLFISNIIALVYKPGFLLNTLLAYAIPSLYLSLKSPNHIFRTIAFSTVFGLLGGFIADFFITYGGGWVVTSIDFPRILGVIPIEDLVWGFLFVYNITIFYEYFLDRNKDFIVNTKIPILVLLLYILFSLILVLFVLNPNLLVLKYPYYVLGLPAFVVFPLYVVYKNNHYLNRFVLASVFFFFQSLMFEIVSLYLDHWHFPGESYLGLVSFSTISFPIEEFIFFPLLFAFSCLAYYEFFFDYKRK